MKYLILILLLIFIILWIVSPTIRNIIKIKHNQKTDDTIGGFLAKIICKQK